MPWELFWQLLFLWIIISTIHPTIVIHHTYDEPPEEEGVNKKVGFHNGQHRDAGGSKSPIGFREKEG